MLAAVSAAFPYADVPLWQHTLAAPFSCAGKGLHSAREIRLEAHPAAMDSGLVFVVADAGGKAQQMTAHVQAVCSTQRQTTLGGANGARLAMVEHVLAALLSLGVDNARLVVSGPEMPGMDGCAARFCEHIARAGLQRQNAPRRFIEVRKPVRVEDGDASVAIAPAAHLRISAYIDYPDSLIGAQSHALVLTPKAFAEDIAPARTFAMAAEVTAMRTAGLAAGGTLQLCLVVDGMALAPGQRLRFENEFARHKILDIAGDLALAGAPILGAVRSHKGGHRLNTALVRTLLADAKAWRWKTLV